MKLPRRTFMQFAGAAATMQAFPLVAVPQSFPMRPIAMIVPIAAGSSLDVFGRIIATDGKVAWTAHHHRKCERS
jgi:tripartite-type tricarboxylate transporter receptor subunit TctC